MSDVLASAASGSPDSGIRAHHVPVAGALRDCVSALVAVQIDPAQPLPLSVVPHESLMLVVQFGRDPRNPDAKAALGHNTSLTGIRQWTGSFVSTLFAVLTPLGAVELLDSRPLSSAPRINARVWELLDERVTQRLEDALLHTASPQAQLQAFGAWLEDRALSHRQQSRAALRAARGAMLLRADPGADIDDVARQQHVSRRQLERDFECWLGTSPRHLSQVVRVQQVAREVHAGSRLAEAAAAAGFGDQPHMTRVVRQLTGLTPSRFVKSQQTPIAAAFRAATGGGTVYL
jgi:AraC-like DNA-binding protein